ncbi:MAG: alpha-glucosidase [Rhodospirillales bacterium]|nr:alpha-glucosidase [Rhodospirillales bacterium]
MILAEQDGFTIIVAGRVVIRHTPDAPFAALGRGTERMNMYRGNFDIADTLHERVALRHARREGASLHLRATDDGPVLLTLTLAETAGGATLSVQCGDARFNRFWFRLVAEPDEKIWGGGEQMSYFNLRGRHFPIWTSEPGVGRDKTSEITRQADAMGHAGGDYYTTNYPQPSFLSSRRYGVHVATTAYSVLDFRAGDYHEIETWAAPSSIAFDVADDFPALVSRLSLRFGRQPPLPEWLYNGAIIGLKSGAASFTRLDAYLDAGARVSALWCEDWAGVRETSFGTRLFWDWRWNGARYPALPERIAALRARGIRFMGYVNPYLCADGTLFPEAAAAGHLARNAEGAILLVDFGEFDCGVVDFTSAAACAWFADTVLFRNMMALGLSGWMADFGEYLPIDAHLASGEDARLMHNAWPTIWARVNAEAIARAGLTGEVLFFMRAGFTGVQRHCPLLWAGDQSVDFSRHDGLRSVIPAALSSGLLGNAYHHSDIGGYTSLFGNVRSAELLMRWAEMAAFTPVMRTHEGNRPGDNLQIDQDGAVLAHFARMTRIWCHLTPYLRRLSAEAAAEGWPAQRPLFFHHENDPHAYEIEDQYLYGPDLLVAPVHAAGAQEWPVYLPAGAEWVHVWSGATHPGGRRIRVPAPCGQPPVFYRTGCAMAALFAAMAAL